MTDEEVKIDISWMKKVGGFLNYSFNAIVYFFLAIILAVNVYIRTLPMKINPSTGLPGLWDITRNNWTLGPDLDPFLFLRHAKLIVVNGALPAIDTLRYSPLGHSTLLETQVLPYLIAYFYKFLHLFSPNVTVEYAAVVLPVVASIFTAIGFFLMVRKIFEWKGIKMSNIIALISTAFLITLPSLLPRTIAGIPEKESLGFGLMFFALYFFIWAWKSRGFVKPMILGALAGAFTALMALVWGGVIFVYAVITIFGLILLVLKKIGKKELIVYSSWIICSAVFWLPFTLRTTVREFFTSATTGSAIAVWVLMIVYFVLFETRLKEMNFLKNLKIPKVAVVIIVSAVLIFLAGLMVAGPQAIIDFAMGIVSKLSAPYYDRLSFTVAENAQPYFSTWAGNFGPLIGSVPLFFGLFFVGSVFLFKEMIKGLEKGKYIFLVSYIVSLLALIFSRTARDSILNGADTLSLIVYISGFVIFAAGAICVYYLNKDNNSLETIKAEYVLLFGLIFIGIIAARNGIRLIMLLAPMAAIPLSYLVVHIVEEWKQGKDDIIKIMFMLLAIVILMASAYTLYYNYQVSVVSAENHIPNQYTFQWQRAMGWVRVATPSDAVFGSWWDYGYWIQSMGERATMLDGGNSISYWDYLMGRHVLTADNESEALELLYNHNVTHYLIDSTEIGKYTAFSSIGSDENYDKFSWIGTLRFDDAQSVRNENQSILVYSGGPVLDEDLLINNGTELLPQGVSGVGAIIVDINSEGRASQPTAIIVYGQKEAAANLRYLYDGNKLIDFETGIEAAVYIIPSLVPDSSGNLNVNPYGAAMYLSPRNMRALWVKMYLLNQTEHFKLVHVESSPVIQSIRSQGLNITSELIYYGEVLGPIKIWEVEYTGEEQYNAEYLQRTYPERIIGRRTATI